MEPSTEATPSTAAAATPAVAEPVATPTPAPQDKAAKRAALIKSVRAAQAAAPVAAPAAAEPVAITTAVAAPALTPTVPADTGLADRIAALEAELNGTKTKLAEREKVRAAPTDVDGLLDLMSENPDMSIEKLSELYLARQDNPAHKALTAAEKRLAAIEAKIAVGEKAEKERAERTAQQAAASEGEKIARSIITADKGRWPRVTRDDRNIVEAMNDAATRAVKKAADKPLSQAQRADAFREALDEVEKDLAERATRYSLPDIAPRRTITNAAGSTGTIPEPVADKPMTHDQRKQAILARVRRGQP